MASNGTNSEIENGTNSGAGESTIGFSSTTLVEVSELIIFGLYVIIQGVNKNLCWHCIFSFFQFTRILLMKKISKIILVCHMLAISDGWSNIIGFEGILAPSVVKHKQAGYRHIH